jgi:uncharacterized protein (TIGR02145 family)
MKKKAKKLLNQAIVIEFLILILVACKKVTPENTEVYDIDGNAYKTVIIGNQRWMAGNLKATKFNNGIKMREVNDNNEWTNLIYSGYCWYNNDSTLNKNSYGALYNWYAVNTGLLCPIGWHVPTNTDWVILSSSLGGVKIAGGKLKEMGTGHWITPNTGATNITGFSALPGGFRYWDHGNYGYIHQFGYWWSSTQESGLSAYFYEMGYGDSGLDFNPGGEKHFGLSVRCIKD